MKTSRFMRSLRLILPLTALLLVATMPTSSAHADTPTSHLNITVEGQGADVILIPGLASSSHVWDATVGALKNRYRLHVVQVKGFAGVPAPNGDAPIISSVESEIHDYIVANGLKKPSVIGHSMGGLIAQLLTIEHPDDVGRLMLVESLPFAALMVNPAAKIADIEPRAAELRELMVAQTQDSYANNARKTLDHLVNLQVPQAQTVLTAMVSSDKNFVARSFYETMTTDLRPRIAEIAVPTTVLYAWNKAEVVKQAEELGEQGRRDALYKGAFAPMKNAQLKRIDDAFHFVMLDQPEVFEREVEAFLAV